MPSASMPSAQLHQVCVDLPVYDGRHRSFRRAVLAGVGGTISGTNHRHAMVRALDGITLDLREGDRIGLIGHNGSGKSTLLRVLAGIYEPTAGRALIAGRASSLLNMSSLLDREMTGYENIDLVRVLLGLAAGHQEALCRDIEDFTELGEFLHMPVRTYSQGMQMRLSLALLTAQETEILLLDEVLGAGDAGFVDKAARRINILCDRAGILVLASHAPEHIRRLCNKIVWLDHGRLRGYGPIDEMLAAYERAMRPPAAG